MDRATVAIFMARIAKAILDPAELIAHVMNDRTIRVFHYSIKRSWKLPVHRSSAKLAKQSEGGS